MSKYERQREIPGTTMNVRDAIVASRNEGWHVLTLMLRRWRGGGHVQPYIIVGHALHAACSYQMAGRTSTPIKSFAF